MTFAQVIRDTIAANRPPRARTVPIESVKWLGRIHPNREQRGRFDYCQIDGREHRVDLEVQTTIRDLDPAVTAIEMREGYRYATEVERGTFARLKAFQDAAEARAAQKKAHRPMGLLEVNPALAAADGSRFRQAVRGVRGLLELLERKDVRLSVAPNGHLLVTGSAGRVPVWLAQAVTDAERLIVGILTGHPVQCELRHGKDRPEAFDIATVATPVCEAHLKGEIE